MLSYGHASFRLCRRRLAQGATLTPHELSQTNIMADTSGHSACWCVLHASCQRFRCQGQHRSRRTSVTASSLLARAWTRTASIGARKRRPSEQTYRSTLKQHLFVQMSHAVPRRALTVIPRGLTKRLRLNGPHPSITNLTWCVTVVPPHTTSPHRHGTFSKDPAASILCKRATAW